MTHMRAIALVAACAFIFTGSVSIASAHTLNPKLVERLTDEKIQPHVEATSTDPRGEERTFASFPEWYIVYSAEEYANYAASGGLPSGFPYFKAIGQYWDSVENATKALDGSGIDSNTNTVLRFIGVSFTLENVLIGAYENTIGRLSEALNFFKKSDADMYIDGVSKEYGDFLMHTPWYAFPYFEKIPGLWKGTLSDLSIRGVERRVIFTVGYTLKGLYGIVIGKISNSSLGVAVLETNFTTESISAETLGQIPGVKVTQTHNDGHVQATAPRYRAFKPVVEAIVQSGGRFLEIQENSVIMLTVVTDASNECAKDRDDVAFSMAILTQPENSRFAFKTEVTTLHALVGALKECQLSIEHIYDY